MPIGVVGSPYRWYTAKECKELQDWLDSLTIVESMKLKQEWEAEQKLKRELEDGEESNGKRSE